MNSKQILEDLLLILEENNIEIRKEPLASSAGGLCKIKNKHIFFLDTQAPSIDSAIAAASVISRIVDIENIYIRPELRQFIEDNK